jgi:hypothetical protein
MIRCLLLGRWAITAFVAAGLVMPGVVSPPAAAAAGACPATPVTLQVLLDLAADKGPLATKYNTEPMLLSEAALGCYGDETLRFAAYVRDPGEVGWVYAYGIEPAWFRGLGLFVATTSGQKPGYGPITALAIPPGLGDLQAAQVGHWVTVTGHFDDPAAATCTATGEPGVAPTSAMVVTICRSIFVVAGVSRAGVPATATSPVVPQPAAPPAGFWLAVSGAVGGLVALWLAGRPRRVSSKIPGEGETGSGGADRVE